MIALLRARERDRKKMHNLLQKYLYDMSRYYNEIMDDNGEYSYQYLSAYFEDADRYIYFICDDARTVGFVMINKHSHLAVPVDFAIAEFTIFPSERGKGYAWSALKLLFDMHKGKWSLKYSLKNSPGMALWQKVEREYGGFRLELGNNEIALGFTVS